jgi:cytochrome c biogenesis protein CcmG/thiol:disulfide interchange protein DsbE
MTHPNAPQREQRTLPLQWVALGAIIALLLVGQVLASRQVQEERSAVTPPTGTPTEEPGPIIDFTVQDLSGQSVRLSDYRGKVVLVNFWATWCSPCKEEMPILEEYYLEHRDQGFTLVGVNVSDRPDDVAAFVEEADYTFPIWLDPPGNVLIDLRVNGLPASLLVDTEGRLRQKWVGPLTPETLGNEISPLLPPPTK